MKNYIDEKGNYINIENLTLRQIYDQGFEAGKTKTPKGDLIDRDALKHKFAQITYIRFTADMGQGGFEMFSEKEIEDIIDNAPTVEDRYSEGYFDGYLDGSTGADMRI